MIDDFIEEKDLFFGGTGIGVQDTGSQHGGLLALHIHQVNSATDSFAAAQHGYLSTPGLVLGL